MLRAYHQTRLALGSDCTLVLVSDDSAPSAEARMAELWQIIYRFERQFSRFLPDSELTRFNQRAGFAVPVSSAFAQLLATAKHLALMSEGFYNPFILPALQQAGYMTSMVDRYRNDQAIDYTDRQIASPQELEVGPDWARIPFRTALDLGGCGKGYLADRLAASRPAQGLAGFWFSLGGDITGAGHDEDGSPWRVSVAAASGLPEQAWFNAPASGFAVATSGPGLRRGLAHGRPWHHIIDPRTRQPAQTEVLLATVMATSAALADVTASSLVVAGADEALAYARRQGSTGAWLQWGQPARQLSFGPFEIPSQTTTEAAYA